MFDPSFLSRPLLIDSVNLLLEFNELGERNNFAIRGEELIRVSTHSAHTGDRAAGFAATVLEGAIALSVAIDSFLVDEQKLGLDNIVAHPQPATLALLAFSGLGVCRGFRGKKSWTWQVFPSFRIRYLCARNMPIQCSKPWVPASRANATDDDPRFFPNLVETANA